MTDLEYIKKYYDGDISQVLDKVGKVPVQYLVGNVDFYGYNFIVNENTLIPRFETEQLVEKTINFIKEYKFLNPKILDIGTGTGCIAITLANEIKCDLDKIIEALITEDQARKLRGE